MERRVLVIDFDPVSAELTGALLATRGLPFVLARNLKELEQALAAGPPALVLLDPALPDETEGLRLCAQLVDRLGPRGSVPIILASRTLRGARWKSLARGSGAELFLERPTDDRLLLAAADRAIGAARAAAPPAEVSLRRSEPRASSAAVITTSARHAPPPAENELESMVDEMFAQWFAEGEPPGASGPPTTGSAPSFSATRAPAGAAAVAEPPAPVASPRAPSPVATIALPARTRVEARARGTADGPAIETARAEIPPRTMTGPTGPASAPVPRPAPPAAVPSRTVPAEASDSPSRSGSPRLVAVVAAIALIGVGIGFVVLQGGGGDAVTGEERAATHRPALAPPISAAADHDETVASAESGPLTADSPPPVPAPSPAAAASRPASAKTAPSPPASDPAGERKAPPIVPAAPIPAPAAQEPPAPESAPAPAGPVASPRVQEAPEPEFVPTITPGALPESFDLEPDATLARLIAPQLIGSSRVDPTFPPMARQMRMSGQVKLRVQVRADGRVGTVSVLSEPTPKVGFGKAAEAAVRQWRYRPATLGSRAVDTEIDVVVHFASD